ncbi:hypothetical protein [Enterobacter hormaechei]|uniref:hypothetical protein n=1 Tax=Enterobacter hormaechei TaxID=158836 RepID=UPI00384AA4C3
MTAPDHTGFPSCVQHISHDITGIKLEPIVALSSSRTVGAEVLSVLSPHQQSEGFFHDWSAARALMLLEAQIAALKKTLSLRQPFHKFADNRSDHTGNVPAFTAT